MLDFLKLMFNIIGISSGIIVISLSVLYLVLDGKEVNNKFLLKLLGY